MSQEIDDMLSRIQEKEGVVGVIVLSYEGIKSIKNLMEVLKFLN